MQSCRNVHISLLISDWLFIDSWHLWANIQQWWSSLQQQVPSIPPPLSPPPPPFSCVFRWNWCTTWTPYDRKVKWSVCCITVTQVSHCNGISSDGAPIIIISISSFFSAALKICHGQMCLLLYLSFALVIRLVKNHLHCNWLIKGNLLLLNYENLLAVCYGETGMGSSWDHSLSNYQFSQLCSYSFFEAGWESWVKVSKITITLCWS